MILDKSGKPELMDASNFTRYFKGIKLSVTDTDGYLLQFNPNDMEMVMYYTNEKKIRMVLSQDLSLPLN